LITLVEVGARPARALLPGERYVIQPAVDTAPSSSRALSRRRKGDPQDRGGLHSGGHLAEYVLISEEILAANWPAAASRHGLPYAHAALSEPFSCVISAQDHHLHLTQDSNLGPRGLVKGLKRGGVTVVIGAGAMGRMHVALAMSYRPRALVVADLVDSRLEVVKALFSSRAQTLGITLCPLNPRGMISARSRAS